MSAFDLQSEEDVKEYLEKLLTEYQFGCYAEKNAEGINRVLCEVLSNIG